MTRQRLGVECLEGRDCPAVVLFNGVLSVTGTSGNDTLTISQSGNWIFTQGKTFDANGIYSIVITGLGGDDVVTNSTAKPGTLYGGVGKDRLMGGTVNDMMYGGHGDDWLHGRPGNDTIFGGAGTDTIVGGTGTNNLKDGSPAPSRTNSLIEQQIIASVNRERAKAGLPALTVNGQLNVAAFRHTQDMVALTNVYGPAAGHNHTLFGTTRPRVQDRLDGAGYDNWTNGFGFGENIAYGFNDAPSVMAAWMASAGHRGNILHEDFTEIGVSVKVDNAGRLFFTQVFGFRA